MIAKKQRLSYYKLIRNDLRVTTGKFLFLRARKNRLVGSHFHRSDSNREFIVFPVVPSVNSPVADLTSVEILPVQV